MTTNLLSNIRPRVHYARVPKGVGSADICRELVKRFTLSELKCVQDYGLGKFEVTFANDEASRRFSDDPVLAIGDARIRFQYRGVRVKVVRVIGFPADADVRIIVQLLEMFGKVLEVVREESAYLPGVWSGALMVKMEMHKSVPNLHQVRDVVVQFEYEGVARVCLRCYRTGHHAAKCTVPQCVRCGAFGHDQCAVKFKHCGGDHGPSQCKVRTNSSAAPPVASSSSQEQEGKSRRRGRELAEALTLSAAAEPSPASPAGAPGTSPADAPAAEEKQEPMSWSDAVRGKKRRANRSPGPSKERLAAAPSGGPGSPKDDLPVPTRAAATESDEESTSSTVTDGTAGELNNSSSCPNCGPGNCECSLMSNTVYSSTNEDSLSEGDSRS
ncbi:hypothetical protein MRX96_052811 [Rhipicephalus microplus]